MIADLPQLTLDAHENFRDSDPNIHSSQEKSPWLFAKCRAHDGAVAFEESALGT